MLMITPTFTDRFNSSFGANAAAARNAWIAAAQAFTRHFANDIHINIKVHAVPGIDVFGASQSYFFSISYSDLRARIVARAKTQDDQIAISAGGSLTGNDPTNGTGTWWLTRPQAKALGLIQDDLSEDGITTFGAGNHFTFSGEIVSETYDFQGIAAHEISEVMGRVGLSGGAISNISNSFTIIDNYSYSSPGVKRLQGGPGTYFSIDNGTTLVKEWHDATHDELDTRDWAAGTNDAFNQFSSPNVKNPVSAIDLQLMDVIGYDVATPAGIAVAAAAPVRASGVVRPG
jgi:hypothetical protein